MLTLPGAFFSLTTTTSGSWYLLFLPFPFVDVLVSSPSRTIKTPLVLGIAAIDVSPVAAFSIHFMFKFNDRLNCKIIVKEKHVNANRNLILIFNLTDHAVHHHSHSEKCTTTGKFTNSSWNHQKLSHLFTLSCQNLHQSR